MKQAPKQQSEDTPVSNPEEYDQNLEKVALSMLTKGSIKHKVRDFKTRVFGLLIIYLQKIKSVHVLVQALIPVLNQIQPADVPKLDNLLREALKKSGTIQISQLRTLVEHYQKLIIKTAKWKNSKRITQTFGMLLRALLEHGALEEEIKGIVVGLQEKYIYKRGVKIHPQSLQYLIKKFKFVKDSFYDSLQKALSSQSLRQAMKKQARRMLRWFGKDAAEIKLE